MRDDTQRIIDLTNALTHLADAVEKVGKTKRNWPREMHLEGTHKAVEKALEGAYAAMGSDTP